jgi:tetratricopeptide (TPR) repeat protein
MLLVYALYYLNSVDTYYIQRSFTLNERVFSEGVILFEYLRQLIAPDITVMGPYQDDIWRIRGAETITWLALPAWLLLLSLALVWRHRIPTFAFGVLFFLAGHLLESTIFSLELYFEHRNYLPSLGPISALVAAAWATNKQWPKYTSFGFAAVMGLLLWQTTTLWGSDKDAAIAWNKKHPTSTRATQNLATYYQKSGDFDKAASTIIKGYYNNRFSGPLALNVVISMCFDTPTTQKYQFLLEQIADDAQKLDYNTIVIKTLHNQISLFANGKCNAFNANHSIAIAKGLLTNRAYQKPIAQYGLLMAIARAMETQGRKEEAIQTKISAYRISPGINTAHTIFFQLLEIGRKDTAVKFLSEARKLSPSSSAQYDSWEKSINSNLPSN